MRKRDIKKVLRSARKLIRIGWIKHIGEKEINGVMCYCSIGSISAASLIVAGTPSAASELYTETLPYFRIAGFDSKTACIADWNDDPTTTHQDVLDKFTAVINSIK